MISEQRMQKTKTKFVRQLLWANAGPNAQQPALQRATDVRVSPSPVFGWPPIFPKRKRNHVYAVGNKKCFENPRENSILLIFEIHSKFGGKLFKFEFNKIKKKNVGRRLVPAWWNPKEEKEDEKKMRTPSRMRTLAVWKEKFITTHRCSLRLSSCRRPVRTVVELLGTRARSPASE